MLKSYGGSDKRMNGVTKRMFSVKKARRMKTGGAEKLALSVAPCGGGGSGMAAGVTGDELSISALNNLWRDAGGVNRRQDGEIKPA